jgi:hypothetical protein
MSAIKLSTPSSGSISLSPANTASNLTITVPAVSGTMLTTASTFAGTGPAFSVFRTAAQSISAGTLTKVQFETENFDTNSNYDNITNYRFTPTVAGYYQVNLSINFASNSGQLLVSIYKNGSRGVGGEGQIIATLSGGTIVNCSNIVYMNGSTDYLEGYAFSGAANSFNTGANNTFFSGAMVRAA